ncbi:arabinosaccharide transport system permease protein [Propionispira arboris]|uniref:Arabinosaccharide transport system permease protein n=1 Tax=Propionispira arboris TaxID=84035 RepID=A0A1H6TLA4_9FIRM|nr:MULTISPECIES: carbohydrate ABC transporter permease [Propionispira]SEI80838.1 arabinosaccharide transport system permease protein [Propionispira arboris]
MGPKITNALVFVILLIFAVFCLAPFFFLVISSLRPGVEMIRQGISLNIDFSALNFDNYVLLLDGKEGIYLSWYFNSVVITVVHTLLSLLLTSMVGYGLAMYNFKGKNAVFIIVLVVMMIPVEILILPLYELSISTGLIDSYLGVILPFVVAPMSIFFFRQYAQSLPRELLDAGRIDGCGEFKIFFKIMLPLMKPAFGAMGILQAMFSWNNFVWPLIVLRSNDMLTLPIGLQSLITPYGNNYDILFPGAVMSVIPIIILFILNQKAFISGLTVGGVKG